MLLKLLTELTPLLPMGQQLNDPLSDVEAAADELFDLCGLAPRELHLSQIVLLDRVSPYKA